MPESTFLSKKSKSYRCLNCILTKKGQYISFGILLGLLGFLGVALFTLSLSFIAQADIKAEEEYNIEAAMRSGLMIDCEYIVTPWYINLCQNQDDINSYAWRQFKLLKTDNPDCVDVHERTPCRDSNSLVKANQTRLWPNACPLSTMLEEDDYERKEWMHDLRNTTETSLTVKMPLIYDLKPYLNQTIRAMDLFMVCPNCFYRGCDGHGNRLIFNIRHGWPYTFAACSYKLNNEELCRTFHH